jgi:prepilin-type processing-associated H-X9-DG protein
MTEQQTFSLPADPTSDTIIVNNRCALRVEDAQRLVIVAGLPVHHYSATDAMAEAYALVLLVDSGFATQREVARAFVCSERTVRRHQQRYAEGGMTALATRSGWRPGRRRVRVRRALTIERLKAEGHSNREIARRLGLTENAIRKQVGPSEQVAQETLPLPDIKGNGAPGGSAVATPVATPPAVASALRAARQPDVAAATPQTAASPNGEVGRDSSEEEPVALSLDVDPRDRTWDRLLAAFGLLDDAAPMFAEGTAVPGAGVLFALPALYASGIFRVTRKLYGDIGPAFYGLRTTVLTLLFMALWRIKRPEALKERDPATLGRVLGLDRAPEVKTVRRKLTRMASYHQAERLGAELARLRVHERGRLMGFLYVDGHVRVYHGKRELPKTHVARMRLSLPATTDYWVNDRSGDPLFVMTAAANAGMVKMLPMVLQEVRALVGKRRVTVVFDRGGWSPKLFKKLLADGFDILTYRKGKARRISEGRFVFRSARLDGRRVEYRLNDQAVRFLKGTLRLRQVTRLCDDGHQTQVLTSRWDLPDIQIAYRMFERWRQENFFKYMREEFLIDALADYHVEADDPTRTVPNPERRTLDREISSARAVVAKLEQTYGAAAVDNAETRRPTMRGFKIAHGSIGKPLRAARDRLGELLARRRALPQRVAVCDVTDGTVVKLATERKHLTNIVRMVAYQAESDLLAALQPHYARTDEEGRTLLQDLFLASADIHVAGDKLQVTLAPLSAPHRTLAVQALCEALNESETVFPGTSLKLRFAVRAPTRIGLAFPGPRSAEPLAAAHSAT